MILKRIKLNDYQIYRNFETTFSSMTFIRGKNGAGKTTLGLESILFSVWGYSSKNLSDIPTRGKAKTCSVLVEIDHDGHIYIIERRIPTFLKIIKDGNAVEFETTTEGQAYLNKLFGEPMSFKQFRMIDNEVGINLLDPKSSVTFKKIIFSISEDQFNRAKENLSRIKQEREIWNKDSAVIYSHAPSEKRMNTLKSGIQRLQNEYQSLLSNDNQFSREEYSQNNLVGQIQGQIRNIESQKAKMSATSCYACGQSIDISKNREILERQQRNILDLRNQLSEACEILKEIKEMRVQAQAPINGINQRIHKLSLLVTKLEGRLKQKNFIYTTQDVEIAKRAIKELDVLSTTFLVNSIKSLEPIINEVLAKIQYSLEFDINDKGKFDIKLINRNGEVFAYKDLSTGQRLMLQIAFKLALLIERGESGLIIADEGLSSLDKENLLHVLKIFENYPFQLICILHHFEEIPAGVQIIDLEEDINEENKRAASEALGMDS